MLRWEVSVGVASPRPDAVAEAKILRSEYLKVVTFDWRGQVSGH